MTTNSKEKNVKCHEKGYPTIPAACEGKSRNDDDNGWMI